MAKKSSYKHYSLNQAKRYTLNVDRFGGVDFSNQRFNVASNHAIDIKDFIYKDEVVQVREGFEELYRVEHTEYLAKDFATKHKKDSIIKVNAVNFNGMWKFLAEDGQEHIVAHIGKLLYELKQLGTNNITFDLLSSDNQTDTGTLDGSTVSRRVVYEFENYKSSAFVGANKLWFLGGNKYMVIRFKQDGTSYVEPVEDNEDTYIPTTAMSITYKNAKVAGGQNYDYPNNMTMWRKNRLLSGVGINEDALIKTDYYEYPLDGSLRVTKEQEATPSNETKKKLSKIHVIIEERGNI